MNEPEDSASIFRILDAAINRTGEGIRVVEDYVRMAMGDAFLSGKLKQLRHDLAQSLSSIDLPSRIFTRDSENDVGRNNQTQSEYQRSDNVSILRANIARVQQSLRAIEEYTKTIDESVAKSVEQLRYRSYTLEKAIMVTALSRQSLAECNLYVLIDGSRYTSSKQGFERHVLSLVTAGVDLFQFRDKSMTDRQQVEIGQCLTTILKDTPARWIMNDRADLAVVAGAEGVHLGQDDLSVALARKIVGASRLIGVSSHSIDQARQAVIDGANYIGVGPVFASQTKTFGEFVGLGLVQAVAREIRLPAFAIGGIGLENIADVCDAGLRRVAVSASVEKADDPVTASKVIKAACVA